MKVIQAANKPANVPSKTVELLLPFGFGRTKKAEKSTPTQKPSLIILRILKRNGIKGEIPARAPFPSGMYFEKDEAEKAGV